MNQKGLSTVVRVVGLGILLLAVTTGCSTAKKVPEAVQPATAAPAPATPAPVAPAAEATPAPAPAPLLKENLADDTHVVQPGECLWCIAGQSKIYADPFQWPIIYKRNAHQIQDADLIYPGQELKIPRDLTGTDVTAAIQHAKNRGAWLLGDIEASDLDYLNSSN